MEIQEMTGTIRQVADQYAKEFDVPYDADWIIMKLQEEFGELVQSHLVRTYRTRKKPLSDKQAKKALAEETADVFCYILLLAQEFDIDLEQSVKDKWFSYLT